MGRPVEPHDADQWLAELSELRASILDLANSTMVFRDRIADLSAKVQVLRQQIAMETVSGGIGDDVDPGNARRRGGGN